MVRSGNTIGSNFAKFGFWLSGYYDDFQGSRCIADDSNTPSADNAYDANATHHGNVLNGEATLNPRYRWSVRDRANNSEFSSSDNYLLLNDGVARWATTDTNRLSKGRYWEGQNNLQFPSGWVHPNRLRYDKAGVASTDDTFLKFSSTNDTSARYIVPLGDTDASFGRKSPYTYSALNWLNGTRAGYPSSGTEPDFMQTAHLTGCWMGERIQINAYTLASNPSAHENNPERIFNPIKSKASKPFLCVQTYMNELNDNRLNNVGNAGQYRPVIAYNGSLNSRGDGEYFGIRMATHSMNGNLAAAQPNGIAINADSSVPPEYVIKVGFPKNTTFGTTGSGGGTPAINWTIRPDAGHGLSAVVPFYHMIWDAGTAVTPSEPWFDLDFKIDYTNNKFKVYHDGTEVTATNATAGAYSDGYTMNNNTQTSAAFKPNEMTGWEMFVTNYLSGTTTAQKKAQINTMIDRVALYKPLTDHPDGTNYSAPVNAWKCSMPANGISSGSIKVIDDATTISLTSLFTDANISDWRVLLFNGNIDRPIWTSVIEKMSIRQIASDRTREITFSFRDSLSLLDRQIATWEIGQIGFVEDDVINARREEMSLLSDMMFFGCKRLEVGNPTLGFESPDYKELHNQRTTQDSAFPIQIYNNEDEYGPNNVENEWIGYEVKGITKDATSAVEVIVGTGFPSGSIANAEIFGTQNHNHTGTKTGSGTAITVSGLSYTANSSATLQEITLTAPSTYNGSLASSKSVWFKFSSRPNRGSTDDELEVGDLIYLPDDNATATILTGEFEVVAYVNYGGNFYVLTDRDSSSGLLPKTGSFPFTIDRGYIQVPTSGTNFPHRNQHAVWMRDLPKSSWFQKHFGNIKSTADATGTIAANVTTSDVKIQVSAGIIAEMAGVSGVGQIVDSDGFVDTFTFTGVADMTNEYLVGVSGLSKDHSSGATLHILDTSEDYKHCWVLWADMRNNGDADADNTFRKNEFGILKPVADNYEISIVMTDQLNDAGDYDEFTSLKIGEDIDVWEIDGETDPSTNAEWSKPPVGAMFRMSSSSGSAINSDGGRARIIGQSGSGSNFAVGDFVHIMEASPYNGTHKIHSISGDDLTLETTATSLVTFDNTVGNWYRKCGGTSTYRESSIHDWEDKGGAFIIIDAAKFFNLNTFANFGTVNQDAGGNTDLGDFVTEFAGFPVLIDNYWKQASSTHENNATPYGFQKDYRRWLIDTGELNRDVLLEDRVIELKPSTTDLTKFAPRGFGKIIATRGDSQQGSQEEIFWYAYKQKLDTAVTETATSAASNAGTVSDPLVITCSGADFVNDGVKKGMRVRNVTAKWVAQITSVTATTLTIGNVRFPGGTNGGQGYTGGVPIYQETGSTRTDVQVGDTIDIPMQLSQIYVEADGGRNIDSQTAYDLLMGILADNTQFDNGSACELKLKSDTNTSGYEKVVVGSSTGADSALRFLLKIDGFIESLGTGTYFMHDKVRAMWSLILSDTWLAQSSAPLFFDISSIPQLDGMTTDGTNSNADSFGSILDARGGKTIFSIIRESVESTGLGSDTSTRLPITYQIGRDNRMEIRPTYNSGEAITRDNLMVSTMDASMGGQVTNVRAYYNNGASFIDFPEATLNQTYRWKIIELPSVRSAEEAISLAQEEYNKATEKAIRVKGEIIRDLDDEDKMLKGRYGYIVDVSRNMERSAVQQSIFGPSAVAKSNDYNYAWSSQAGCLFPGSVNALDGNLKSNGTDATYKRERYGAGYYAQGGSGTTDTYDDWYWWWGANSLAHAVQVVHIPTGCPLDSDTTTNDLRVWVALKDGQSGTDIDNAEFTIGLSDVVFDDAPGTRFTSHYSTDVQFAPSYAATVNTFSTVDVKRNGFYEITVPTGYWTTGRPTDPKITVSVNVNYLRALLRRRCGDPTASGILHNAHDITELKTGSWSATNSDSIFPIGCHKYDNMSGAYGTRYVWYGSRLHVVEDLRWRPATTVTYTDSGLGLSNEPMIINKIDWSIIGNDVEQLSLELERDQTKTAGGLTAYLFPNVAKGRTSNPGGQPSSPPPDKPNPPPSKGPGGTGGGTGGGGGYKPSPGPIGETPFSPNKVEGGRLSSMSKGGFSKTFGANNVSAGLNNKIKGKMKLGNDGLSNNTFGILGQPKPAPSTSIQRGIDGLDSSIKPASAGATQTSEGWVFPGIFDPDSSDVFTHEQSIITRVPEDVAANMVGVMASVSLGGTDTQRATLTVKVECEETSSSITRLFNVSGNTDKATVALLSSTPLDGADVGGNNIKVTISRTPNTDDDDADNSTLVLHSVKVNFQRSSLFGRDAGTYGFSPY